MTDLSCRKKKQNLLVLFYPRRSVDLHTGKDDRNRPSLVEDILEKESARAPRAGELNPLSNENFPFDKPILVYQSSGGEKPPRRPEGTVLRERDSVLTVYNAELWPLTPAFISSINSQSHLHLHKHCLTYTNALLHYDPILTHCRVFLCVTTPDTPAQLEFQFKCLPCAVASRTSICLEGNTKLQGWALNMFMAEGTIEITHNLFPQGLPVTLFQFSQKKVRLCLKSFFTYIQLQ